MTQWHPACRHCSVWWRTRSAFLSPKPLVFIMCLLFPSVRLFFAVWRCQGKRVFFPLPWLYKCVLMAVRRDTLCIVLGRVVCQLSWMALAEVFLRPLCFSVITSAVCEVFGSHVKPYTDKFRPKTGWVFFHNISIKIHQMPDVGHPSTAVSIVRSESLK